MFCRKCGKEIQEEWSICPHCGTPLKEDEEIQTNEKPKKKKFYKIWIILCVIVALIVAVVSIRGINGLKEQEILEKLDTFTTVYKGDGKYYFLDNGEKWVLTYTSENEFVSFENDTVINCFTDAFGEGCFAEGSVSDLGFSYDLSDNEARIYFDVDIEEGHLSIVNYNLSNQEYDLMFGLDNHHASDEFNDFVEYYGLSKSIEQDVKEFKELLRQNGLTIDDLLKVKLDTLESQFIPDMEGNSIEVEQEENEFAISQGFIGMSGDYICTNVAEDEWTGRIQVLEISEDYLIFELGCLDYDGPQNLLTAVAYFEDDYTAVYDDGYGFVARFSWVNPETIYVEYEGELAGTDCGPIMDFLDSRNYYRAPEFN